VRKGAEKLTKFLNVKQQGRLDGFFTREKSTKDAPSKSSGSTTAKKRKARNLTLASSFHTADELLQSENSSTGAGSSKKAKATGKK
jgi:hypothetical protein